MKALPHPDWGKFHNLTTPTPAPASDPTVLPLLPPFMGNDDKEPQGADVVS